MQCSVEDALICTERDADIPLALRSEDEAGGDEHPCLVEHTLGELLAVGIAVGNTSLGVGFHPDGLDYSLKNKIARFQ